MSAMTTSPATVFDRPRPMQTGGGGTVIELLIGLATGVAAVLAAMAWQKRKPTVGDASLDEADEASSDAASNTGNTPTSERP